MTRAEQVKSILNDLKAKGKYHEQIKIEENACDYGYNTIFGPYLDEIVVDVKVEDPYIRSYHQVCSHYA